jgi:O-acetyl-ADP-ribose deacetylase (regulator of RNase III)
MRCGDAIAYELQDHFRRQGRTFVAPGTVVVTSPATLNTKYILHAVSINGFYESSPELVAKTLREVWRLAMELEVKTIAIPALATDYGPLSMAEFAQGLRDSLEGWHDTFGEITVVLLKQTDVEIVNNILNS